MDANDELSKEKSKADGDNKLMITNLAKAQDELK